MAKNQTQASAPTSSDAVVGSRPSYLKNATAVMQPAGLPGQLPTIAAELASGFGVPQQMMTDAIYKMYQPAATMNFGAPAVAPKPVPKATTKPASKPVTSPLNMNKPTPVKTPSLGRNAR